MNTKRAFCALLIAPLAMLSVGCVSEISGGLAAIEACRAATTVSTTPAEETEAIAEAAIAFAAELPAELQPAALTLALPPGVEAESVGTAAVAPERAVRLQALADLQAWTMETCGSYLTIGAPLDAGIDPADVRLADFETLIGEDNDGVYVSVLGVGRDEIALALCEQALANHAILEAELHVQVLDAIGQAVAVSAEKECVLVEQ